MVFQAAVKPMFHELSGRIGVENGPAGFSVWPMSQMGPNSDIGDLDSLVHPGIAFSAVPQTVGFSLSRTRTRSAAVQPCHEWRHGAALALGGATRS